MRVPRVFPLDGLALAYRSHFAFIRRPLVNARGEHTSALFAFANTVIKLRTDEKPDYWVLAWDAEAPTLRSQEFADYKATRKPMPEELAFQLPHIKELAAALGLPLLEAPGYEADDVMATLARRAVEAGMEAVLVTNDKDLQQLVRPGVRVLAPARGRADQDLWMGEEEVEAKWGVKPAALRDLFALMGDSTDNVPGVPGIGEKTASKLIAQFGGLDQLYARLGEVDRESLRQKLADHKEAAYFSRKLVTVQDDLDLPPGWEGLTVRAPDADRLQALGQRFQLRRLLSWADQVRGGSAMWAGAGGTTVTPASAAVAGNRPAEAPPVGSDLEVEEPAVEGTAASRAPTRREAAGVQGTLTFETAVEAPLEPYGPPVRIIDTAAALDALARELAESSRGF